MLLLLGVLEVFEEVRVEDRGANLVVARGPLAEVDGAATVGAEGDVGVGGEDGLFADGAGDGFGHGDYPISTLIRKGSIRVGIGTYQALRYARTCDQSR